MISGGVYHPVDYADGGVISDQRILLNGTLQARLIVFKDYLSDKVLRFVSNMFDYQQMTITQLYRYRWNIEVLFKQLKQNFELSYFFSDSSEGIKTQIWIALISQLIFSVIHRQIKEAEDFVTLVSVASNNMGAYIDLISIMKTNKLNAAERDLQIVQLQLFDQKRGGVFRKIEKSP